MKNIIKSVEMKQSENAEYEYEVIFRLFDEAGDAIFEEINDLIQVDMIDPEWKDCLFPCRHGAHSILFKNNQLFLFDGEIYVDSTRGWYSFWTKNDTQFSICWDTEKEEWSIRASFEKIKEGLDKYDYTKWDGIPENAWIEPLQLIRDIFS